MIISQKVCQKHCETYYTGQRYDKAIVGLYPIKGIYYIRVLLNTYIFLISALYKYPNNVICYF